MKIGERKPRPSVKFKRRQILALAKLKEDFLKGKYIPAEELLTLARHLGIEVHGQTKGKMRSVVRTIDNMGNLTLRIDRKFKSESLRGCRILALEIHIILLRKNK